MRASYLSRVYIGLDIDPPVFNKTVRLEEETPCSGICSWPFVAPSEPL